MIKRKWGYWNVLKEGKGFKVKELVVLPHKCLSYQEHNHRTEHWTVVEGKADIKLEIMNDGIIETSRFYELKENNSLYIDKKQKHQIRNKSDKPVKIIEVQVGDYIEEDDIIRYT